MQEKLALGYILNALMQKELRWHVHLTTPVSLQAAIAKAERAELILSVHCSEQHTMQQRNPEQERGCQAKPERAATE